MTAAARIRASARSAERPARPEARPLRRLHRLLELSRMPLYAAARARERRRGRRERRRRAARARHRPASGLPVSLRKGPYGHYVQLGEATKRRSKPKRSSLPKGMAPADVDLETRAEAAVAAARDRPPSRDGEPIIAGVGRFGPYIKHGKTFRSLGRRRRRADHRPQPRREPARRAAQGRGAARRTPLRVARRPSRRWRAGRALSSGRYGPYVSHGGVNATLPRDIAPEEVTLRPGGRAARRAAAQGGGREAKPTRRKDERRCQESAQKRPRKPTRAVA